MMFICIGVSVSQQIGSTGSFCSAEYCTICQHSIYISNVVLSADGHGCAVTIACSVSPTLCEFLI